MKLFYIFLSLFLFSQYSLSSETNLLVEISGGNFVQNRHLLLAGGLRYKFEYSQYNLRINNWFGEDYDQFSFPIEFTYSKVRQEYSGFVDGLFGNYMGGINLISRWNPIDGYIFSPYIQCHIGILHNDIYEKEYQSYIGSPFEFSLSIAGGIRLHLPSNFSLMVEYKGEHISNAGLSERNSGINASGFLFGCSKSF